jgi:lipopolysaccharide export system protein LptA
MMRQTLLVLALTLGAAPALAAEKVPFGDLGKSSNEPVNISADTNEADWKAETISYEGAVRITQGEMVMRADKVVAEVPGKKITRVTASGNVIITSRDATATAPLVVYDIPGKTIRLTGDVVLTQGRNTMRGTELLVDLNAGTATLSGKGRGDGRVDGVLYPSETTAK